MIPVQRLGDMDLQSFFERRKAVPREIRTAAARIVHEVRAGGDVALRHLTKRFDGADLEDPWLSPEDWDRLAQACPAPVQAAIRGNLARIQAFHERQRRDEDTFEVVPGVTLGRRPVPAMRAACYVPGGRASYPSTVLMTVVPARIAAVADIIVTTPPRKDGSIDPAVAYAAQAAGATRILRAGGAQAVAAVAIGTQSIPRVEVVVGPGNAYVTAAKHVLRDEVRTDSPAGPSELLIIADETADARFVAADMMAQAEHDPEAQVILVATDEGLARTVAKELEREAPKAVRSATIEASLRGHGAIIVATLDAAIGFSNDYAPEHLAIVTKDPETVLSSVRHAGSVFLGPWAPVSIGDYGSGTNHVLPTMGFARFTGGLSVDHFRKWITWQEATEQGLQAIADDVTTLADAEGLHAHAEAVRRRA